MSTSTDAMRTRDFSRAPLERSSWSGYLTLENVDAVCERMRQVLDGRTYTSVTATGDGRYRPQVRTGNRYCQHGEQDEGRPKVWHDTLTDGRVMAGISWADEHFVWGMSTTFADEEAVRAGAANRRVTVSFTDYRGPKVEIEQHSMSGNHLWWVFAADEPADS